MGGRRGGDIWKPAKPIIRSFRTRPATRQEISAKVAAGKSTGTRPVAVTDPDPTF